MLKRCNTLKRAACPQRPVLCYNQRQYSTQPVRAMMRLPLHLHHLFFNHADAWGLTLLIASTALVLHGHSSPRGHALVACLGLCYWWGFALNDYFDAPYDAQEARKGQRNFFVQVHLSPRLMQALTGGLLAGVLLIFAQFGGRGLLLFAVGSAAMWSYSAPPLRLKRRPGLDLLAHMLFVQTFPYFATVFALGFRLGALDGVLLLAFLLGSLGAQLEQQARDYELDCRTEGNFTTRVGLRATVRALRLVTGLLILLVGGSIALGLVPGWLVPFALLGLPVMLHRFVRDRQSPRSEALIRLTLLACLLYAGWLWGTGGL